MATKLQNRKDCSVSVVFLVYSIFSNRNQISLFSSKTYHKVITIMGTEKSWGAHVRWCAIAVFQLKELNIKANHPCHVFNMRVLEER